jgi:hypothetical protein
MQKNRLGQETPASSGAIGARDRLELPARSVEALANGPSEPSPHGVTLPHSRAADVEELANAGAPTCNAVAGSDPAYTLAGDLQDGQQGGPFFPLNNRRLNVKAEVAPTLTGQRAAALKRCKKRAHKKHWSHQRLRKCKKKAQLLPT